MKRALPLAGLLLVLSSCTHPQATPLPVPDTAAIEMAGVPNLHRVSANLYRSAQPTAEGMRNLHRQLGIRTVINLRQFHSDRELIGDLPMDAVRYPTPTWQPSPDTVDSFLKLVSDPSQGPFLVHCQHGSDRTGSLCAIYRASRQSWTADAAITEMTGSNYGFHPIWKKLPGWTRTQIERQAATARKPLASQP